MAKDSRTGSTNEAARADEAMSLETLIRQRARGLIDTIIEEDMTAALSAAPSIRVGPARHGCRHGARARTLTTSADVDYERGADDVCVAARPRLLLFGLLRSGQVKMRKIDGWPEMERVKQAV